MPEFVRVAGLVATLIIMPLAVNAEDMPAPGLAEYLGMYYDGEDVFDPQDLARAQVIKAREELQEKEALAGIVEEEPEGEGEEASEPESKRIIKKKDFRRANEKSRGL